MKRYLTRAVAALAFVFAAVVATSPSQAGETAAATTLPQTAAITQQDFSVESLLQNVHSNFYCRRRSGYRARMYHGRGGRHLCRYTPVRARNRCGRARSSCSRRFGYNTRNYYRCLGRRGC